jgi:dTDP-4-dehydrorhamnose reductase
VKRAQRRKLRYIITPEGIAFRARLTINYIEQSMRLYRRTRQQVRELLTEVRAAGYDQVCILGDGDLADICRLTCLEQGMSISEVDGPPQSHRMKVRPAGGTGMNAEVESRHVLVTGGAGYIGSLLAGELLRNGWRVTIIDDLLFGGEALLSYLPHPGFHFVKADVAEPRAVRSALRNDWPKPCAVVHLAAIAGFPACQAVGRQGAWRSNVDGTQRVFEQAVEFGAERFVYVSTYSNYGLSPDNQPVTEETPLNPQSLYAETKVSSERYLSGQASASCAPLIFRLAHLYGLSPRTRFDMIVNQFVLEAYSHRVGSPARLFRSRSHPDASTG